MTDYNKKDALTDLVQDVSSNPDQSNQPSNNGSVNTPTGEKVELGYDTSRKTDSE